MIMENPRSVSRFILITVLAIIAGAIAALVFHLKSIFDGYAIIFNGFNIEIPLNRTTICVALACIVVGIVFVASLLIYVLRRKK
jgi:H+/Cl- antiporter ClcA